MTDSSESHKIPEKHKKRANSSNFYLILPESGIFYMHYTLCVFIPFLFSLKLVPSLPLYLLNYCCAINLANKYYRID